LTNYGGSDHEVYETFGWGTSESVANLDAPRTPVGKGAYEHELRFFPSGGGSLGFCEDGGLIQIIAKDLPPNSYFDSSADPNEFTWGMWADDIVQDHTYDVNYSCQGGSSGAWNLTGQIGHWHSIQSQFNVYPDETNKLVPRAKGDYPSTDFPPTSVTRQINASFDDNPSYEQEPNDWHVPNGTKEWLDGGYHAAHMVRVRPSFPGVQVLLVYPYDPRPPSNMATATNYTEFVFRCPTGPNDASCKVRVGIEALNSSGVVIDSAKTNWGNHDAGSGWKRMRITSAVWPSNAATWKFFIEGGDGDTLDVDYHSQWWFNPN
jgi:hypothetical protein